MAIDQGLLTVDGTKHSANGSIGTNGTEDDVIGGDGMYFLTESAKTSSEDGIRALWKYEKPGVVSFVGCLAGRPNSDSFPFESITLNLKPPLGSTSTSTQNLSLNGADLADALQYGPSGGLPKLRSLLYQLQQEVHHREDDGTWGTTVGAGCQNLLNAAVDALMNEGDSILIETPVYPGILAPLRKKNAEMIEVDVDEGGLSPAALEQVMSSLTPDQKRPKLLYVNPIGCNPSGCSHSLERRLEVLKLCKKYGLLILEDDPYYYLAETTIPSYFELEKRVFPQGGRVVRFDSFSKLLSAGLRLGFATGPGNILRAIDTINSGTILHASTVSQGITYCLLEHWGLDGFRNHAHHVAELYARRRETFETIVKKHLSGLATWVSPVAGMFLWMDLSPSGIEDSFDFVLNAAKVHGVLGVPGASFYPNKRISSYMRLSFSVIDLDTDAEEGIARFAAAIKDKQKELGIKVAP
ncbi:pyridoxal phosphate-dependent transferase [Kockovaella imperatae]|uniref:Pyridoxal phosphate-dependent transferase n=1 Tax=Kockovaella imperatae TaxID=4999 RepID=A0A1Y1UMM4_9TREE|nr:pyridoxal phosphate-dependent transferase [Kockovaella imperatae]ORX39311.1 pyridoxal phosphate-dependent transferase [Kockovaella imperatae]